jgi:hypothetical protein
MGTTVAAVVAARRRNARDLADPVGAIRRNQMRALITLIITAIWSGGAVLVVTTVAPAAFRVLPTRALAGALVGQVLPVLFLSGLAIGTLGLVFTTRTAPRHILRRIGTAGTIVGCAVAQAIIGPRIDALREKIGPSVDALAATDPLRLAFGRLHGLSVLCLAIAMLSALLTVVACALAVRDADAGAAPLSTNAH